MLAPRPTALQITRAPAVVRLLSTGAPKPTRWQRVVRFAHDDRLSQKENIVRIAIGAGGVLAVYFVSKGVMKMSAWFMSINFTTVAMWGFSAGFLAAAICGGMAYGAHRLLSIRPEEVFRVALKHVKTNEQVHRALGMDVVSGKLRAYKLDGKAFASKNGKFGWQPPRVQMLFQVVGQWQEGMVTVEAVKQRGRLKLSLLTLDVLSERPELLILHGTPDRLYVAGQLRGFLQAERVKYLAQNRVTQEVDPLEVEAKVVEEAPDEVSSEDFTEPEAEEYVQMDPAKSRTAKV